MTHDYKVAEQKMGLIIQECEDIIDEIATWRSAGKTHTQLEDTMNFIKHSLHYVGEYFEDLEHAVHNLRTED